jgi:hypothetical protein
MVGCNVLLRQDGDRLSLLDRVGNHESDRLSRAGVPGDRMNQVCGIDKALTFFDGNRFIIGKRRKDRSVQHISQTDDGMMVAASISAGRILNHVESRLPPRKAFDRSRTKQSSTNRRNVFIVLSCQR